MKRNFDILEAYSDRTNSSFGAEDFKKMQSVINSNQKEINILKDIDFEKQSLFLLENSEEMNSLYIYKVQGYEEINRTKSKNIRFNNLKKCITGRSKDSEGILCFNPIASKEPLIVSKFQLFSDDYIPEGAKIQYFISNDGYNYTPITANYTLPKTLSKEGDSISVIANLYPSPYGEMPEIYNFAIIYYNKVVDIIYGLKDHDYSEIEIPKHEQNEVVLIRGNNGKVTAILDDFSITKINRNNNNKVSDIFTETNDGQTETTTLFRETDSQGNQKVVKIKTEKGVV